MSKHTKLDPEVKKERARNRRQEKKTTYLTKWLNDEETGLGIGGYSLHIYVREWLLETRGAKCELCGWSELNLYSGRIPVEVDHIDGNHQNSRPDNLRVLCPNCHALTPTYRNLNYGKGRKYPTKMPIRPNEGRMA
jgi:5-methylcytosine-specific restriction endonuclease McrA